MAGSLNLALFPSRWDFYSELMMMYLLGMGIGHRIPSAGRLAGMETHTIFEYDGQRYIGSFAPLFVHQYSQAWFDFRGKRDHFADYFQNSVIAPTCTGGFVSRCNSQFPDYTDALWGITASDSAQGYVAWGGPPAMGPIDGTVVPAAAGGSLPFLARATLRVLQDHSRPLSEGLLPLRVRRCIQSPHRLVRHRCHRHRHRHHHADGREFAHRLCLGDIHEKP